MIGNIIIIIIIDIWHISIYDEIEIINPYHRMRQRVLDWNIEDVRLLFSSIKESNPGKFQEFHEMVLAKLSITVSNSIKYKINQNINYTILEIFGSIERNIYQYSQMLFIGKG